MQASIDSADATFALRGQFTKKKETATTELNIFFSKKKIRR